MIYRAITNSTAMTDRRLEILRAVLMKQRGSKMIDDEFDPLEDSLDFGSLTIEVGRLDITDFDDECFSSFLAALLVLRDKIPVEFRHKSKVLWDGDLIVQYEKELSSDEKNLDVTSYKKWKAKFDE
jgi:hypothetical protein